MSYQLSAGAQRHLIFYPSSFNLSPFTFNLLNLGISTQFHAVRHVK
jgi:hypothetical protein